MAASHSASYTHNYFPRLPPTVHFYITKETAKETEAYPPQAASQAHMVLRLQDVLFFPCTFTEGFSIF